MIDKLVNKIIDELKKIRLDMDHMKDDIATIAVNTTPADTETDDSEPAET